jgi:hypothetical protein
MYRDLTLLAAPNSLVLVRVQHSTSSLAPEPESLLPGLGFDEGCLPTTGTDTGAAAVDPLEAADAYENLGVSSLAPLTGPNEAGGNESIARAPKPNPSDVDAEGVAVAVLVEGLGCIFFVLLPIQESVLQLET